jgi:hypothetical protein
MSKPRAPRSPNAIRQLGLRGNRENKRRWVTRKWERQNERRRARRRVLPACLLSPNNRLVLRVTTSLMEAAIEYGVDPQPAARLHDTPRQVSSPHFQKLPLPPSLGTIGS